MATSNQLYLDFEVIAPLLTVDEIYERASTAKILVLLQEDRRIERKSPAYQVDQLGEYFSMWANTPADGGLIVVGLKNDGEVVGCHSLGQDRINAIESTALHYCPDARYISKRIPAATPTGEQTFLILFRVEYRQDKVVKHVNGKAFIRVADEKKELTAEEVNELAIDRGEKHFEDEPVDLLYPDDFDTDLIQRYADSFRHSRKAPDLPTIKILELKHYGKVIMGAFKPTVAFALVFAKDPLAIFPGCKVRFLRFQGESEGTGEDYNVVKDVPIEGNVPTLINQTAAVLDGQLREFSRLGQDGHFYTVSEYPQPAWFEALVNACIHRSYGLKNMNVFVKMFDDHIEIESPGGFPPLVTPDNIFDMHQPRNPRVMNALFYLNVAREHNEGTKRMRKTMADMLLPSPEFAQMPGGAGFAKIKVTLRNNHKQRKSWVDSDVHKILGEAIVGELDTRDRLILNYVAENGSINASQCLQQVPTCKKWHSAKRLLTKLVERGLLIHHHSTTLLRDPFACYTLPGKQPPPHVHWRDRRRA